MSKKRKQIKEEQIEEIRSLRNQVGQEHLVDVMLRLNGKHRKVVKSGKVITLGMIKSLSRRQGKEAIGLLNQVKNGKVIWLRHKNIPGRYPKKYHEDKNKNESFVYFVSINNTYVKIGVSIDPAKRIASLKTGTPFQLKVEAIIPGGIKTEAKYHHMFDYARKQGEWFRLDDYLRAEIGRLRREFSKLQREIMI